MRSPTIASVLAVGNYCDNSSYTVRAAIRNAAPLTSSCNGPVHGA
ncbi:hypothetical protein JMJ77_0004033, partial [Colletotrichum scovillei]